MHRFEPIFGLNMRAVGATFLPVRHGHFLVGFGGFPLALFLRFFVRFKAGWARLECGRVRARARFLAAYLGSCFLCEHGRRGGHGGRRRWSVAKLRIFSNFLMF